MVLEEEVIWIEKIKRGNTQAFSELYKRHSPKLFSLCYRFTHHPSDAEDQLQEIFIKILDKLDSFQSQSSFATWAYRLATNHLLNFKARTRTRFEAPLEDAPEQLGPQANVPLALAIGRALKALPEGFRNVFILHDQEGFSHEEIADILGIEAATSRSQLTRARLRLREQLKTELHSAKESAV